MQEIRVLPPEIVSRIAAGEVVERPASLIKELVENAIDAHATEIDIDLEEGGNKKVTVRDNGSGMSAEDLPLAFRSHATSKLRVEELSGGLFGVASLGFRGEALASIAAVADVDVVSRCARSKHAYRYRPGHGEVEPAAGGHGTVIDVRNLFHNVPARRKFLRSKTTELSHVLQHVTRLALGYPSIRFRLTHKGKKVLDYPEAAEVRERLIQIIGQEKVDQLLDVSDAGDSDQQPTLTGYVGSPTLRRNDSRDQHFFVDGRWIRNKLLTHAVRSAFQGYLIPGQQPVCYLFLEFPSNAVDVNVHPTKTEVRFRDPGPLYPLIFHAVRRALEADGGVESGSPASNTASDPLSSRRTRGQASASKAPPSRSGIERAALGFFSSRRAADRPEQKLFVPGRASPRQASPRQAPPLAEERVPASAHTASAELEGESDAGPSIAVEPASGRDRPQLAFQVLNSYIVFEDGDGVVFIDQHALHEKILFEGIHRSLLAGDVLKQKLIVPEIVEIAVDQVPLVDRASRLLAPCGYDVELFGDREVAVHAVPKLFDRAKGPSGTRDIILSVFSWLQEDGPDAPVGPVLEAPTVLSEPYRALASMLACKRAVKAGSRLEKEEIDSLLERADLAEDPRHCPHGRPTAMRMTKRELERKFDRK